VLSRLRERDRRFLGPDTWSNRLTAVLQARHFAGWGTKRMCGVRGSWPGGRSAGVGVPAGPRLLMKTYTARRSAAVIRSLPPREASGCVASAVRSAPGKVRAARARPAGTGSGARRRHSGCDRRSCLRKKQSVAVPEGSRDEANPPARRRQLRLPGLQASSLKRDRAYAPCRQGTPGATLRLGKTSGRKKAPGPPCLGPERHPPGSARGSPRRSSGPCRAAVA
jgi:hypothetical protein